MSVIDKAQAALDGTEVTFRNASDEERRAYWTAEVARQEYNLAHTPDHLGRWQVRRALAAAREQLAACTPTFRVIREADGHLMAEYTDATAAAEDAEARSALASVWEREPATYRVEATP